MKQLKSFLNQLKCQYSLSIKYCFGRLSEEFFGPWLLDWQKFYYFIMVRVNDMSFPKAVIPFFNPIYAPQEFPFKNKYFEVIWVFYKTLIKLLEGKFFVARSDVS